MGEESERTTPPDPVNPDRDQAAVDMTGQTIGDYRLLRRLGQGGMGQVYVAEQISLKRKVALKVLRRDLAANSDALQRFKREAEAVARATHANIVQVYAIGEENGVYYMALEYVEGKNLRDFIEKKGPPELIIAFSIIQQAASALQRASELGVIHRDIKPENILITGKGEVKVADFGLSRIYAGAQQPLKLTQSGVTMGTPLYMSPEQVEGKELDPRTDVYSLGVTVYHMFAGSPPFRGQSPFEVAVQHVQNEPKALAEIRPDLPPEVCAAVHKMLAKRPEDRYQTAQEIVREVVRLRGLLLGLSSSYELADLSQFSGDFGSSPSSTPAVTLGSPLRRRRTPTWILAAAVALMFAAGIGFGIWRQLQQSPTNELNGLLATLEQLGDLETVKSVPGRNQEKEAMLIETFKDFQQTNTKDDKRQGMYACINLALFYLNRDLRYDRQEFSDSERFFAELRDMNRESQYRFLGSLGQAMVLAFKDQYQRSNELFEEVFTNQRTTKKKVGKKKLPPRDFLRRELLQSDPYPLHEMLARALQRNYENDPEAFPSKLDVLRTIPTIPPRDSPKH